MRGKRAAIANAREAADARDGANARDPRNPRGARIFNEIFSMYTNQMVAPRGNIGHTCRGAFFDRPAAHRRPGVVCNPLISGLRFVAHEH